MALANSPKIPEETKSAVLNIATHLGYQIQQKNKTKPINQNYNIGMIIDINSTNLHKWNYLRTIIEELSKEIKFRESNFILLPVSSFNSKEDVIKMVKNSGVSGVISFIYAVESVLTELEAHGIPVVLTFSEQRSDKFFYVGHDDFQGAYEATTSLLKLHHHNIAYVYTEKKDLPFLQSNRFAGYKKALTEWNIEVTAKNIIDYNQADITDFKTKILKTQNSINAPTAYLCLDDNLAVILYNILTSSGYNIPADISIIAHGNSLDYSNPLTPQITTMSTDLKLSATICCNILFNRFKEPEKSYSSIKTRETLIKRGSCSKVKT